jgi:hypothetical protein
VPFATGGKAVWAAFDIPDDVAAKARPLPQ